MADKEVSFVVKVKDAASAALKDIQKAGTGVTEKLFGFKDILKDLTAAAAAFSLAEIVKDMIELGVASDKTFRQIAANLPTFTEGLGELKEGIEQIADASGRSIEGMQQSAAAIAKMGVSGAAELKQQLEAATLLADATGNDVTTMAQLLIQLRREFHLTGDEALGTAAKLAAAGRGKIDIAELFSAFQASAPIFQKFHIDVDTATNAIVSMVAQGYGLRQIRAQLNGLDAEGIREWAKQAHVASDAMGELQQRADEVRGSTSAINTQLKNQFNQTLEDLGVRVLPIVNAALLTMIGLVRTVKDVAQGTSSASFFGLSVTSGMTRTLGLPETFSGHGSSRTFGSDGPGTAKPFTPPMSEADKKKLEDAAKALAAVDGEAAKLALTTEAAQPKSVAFAQAINAWIDKAILAKKPIADIEAVATELFARLNQMQRSEALDDLQKQAKDAADAFKLLDDTAAQFSGDALQQFDEKVANFEVEAKAARTKMRQDLDTDDLAAFDQQVGRIRDSFASLRVAIADAGTENKRLVAIQDEMADSPLSTGQISDRIGELANKEADLRVKIQQATDPATAAEYRRELEAIKAVVEALYGDWVEVGGEVDKHKQSLADLVQAWEGVARAATSALHALGVMNDKTANSVNDAINVAQGVGNIAKGNVLAGTAEVISGVADLGKNLLGLGRSASEAANALRKMKDGQDSIASTLANWRAQITGTAQDQKAAALLQLRVQYEQIVQTIESTEAGRKQEDQRNKDLDEAAKLYQEQKTALENNTAAMLTNTGILNAVQGYKLNLQLFNFSPAYGPPSDPASGAPAPVPDASSGGGSSTSHGGTTANDGADMNATINVVLDGKIVATSVVKNLRKMSQAQYGTSNRWNEVVTP